MKTLAVRLIVIAFIIIGEFYYAQTTNHPLRRGEGEASQSPITIKSPWLRPAAQGSNTAFFFEVTNNTEMPDTLLKAESKLSEVVEIHETYSSGNDMMGMRKVKFVVIPPQTTVKFMPRDLHVMLIRLKKDLRIGDKEKITLFFKNSGKIEVVGEVKEMSMMMRQSKRDKT